MISHDESAGLRRFKCADCGKAFKFKHHLKVNLKKLCTFCRKHFRLTSHSFPLHRSTSASTLATNRSSANTAANDSRTLAPTPLT